MNPLAIMAVGVYGRSLPPQNGAPLRLIVPWKYGFKSIKSIVKIRFTATQPKTTWAGWHRVNMVFMPMLILRLIIHVGHKAVSDVYLPVYLILIGKPHYPLMVMVKKLPLCIAIWIYGSIFK
jgi:hypothetical protein